MSHSSAQPLITLTTDFGLTDHYVGTMKGVILSRCPQARIVDIAHGIREFSILSGAYAISQAAPYYPEGSIHVVVVDPGVGTSRRAIVAVAGGRMLIAPDNGVLTLVLKQTGAEVREITNAELFLHPVSSTFHGRDIFAPVAAALACGVSIEGVGAVIHDAQMLSSIEPELAGSGTWRGTVLSVDQFGNVITNFAAERFSGGILSIAGVHVRNMYKTFGAAPLTGVFLYAGSSGYIEIGANRASAAEALRVGPGDAVELSLVQ